MIKIEVDPKTCAPAELRAVAHLFNELAAGVAEGKICGDTVTSIEEKRIGDMLDMVKESAEKIAHADNPSTGTVVATAHQTTDPLPAATAVFGTAPLPPGAIAPDAPTTVFGNAPLPNGAGVALSPNGATPGTTAPPANAPALVGEIRRDLDFKGLPWDARIHAESKAKIKDGTWRTKRGVDPALVTHVEAELRAMLAIPGPNAAGGTPSASSPSPASAGAALPSPPAPVVAAPSVNAPPPPGIPTGIFPPPPVAPGPASVSTFPELMAKITAANVAGQLTKAVLDAVLGEFTIPSLALVSTRPDLIPGIAMRLDEVMAAGVQS